MSQWPVYGKITGPIVLIGFGSIGRGILPLHRTPFRVRQEPFTVIDPDDSHRGLLEEHGVAFVKAALTRDNYREVLTPLLTKAGGKASSSISRSTSARWMSCKLSRDLGPLYRHGRGAVAGLLFRPKLGNEARTNYALRETVAGGTPTLSGRDHRRLLLRRQSWHGVLVRQAGAGEYRQGCRPLHKEPTNRAEWGALARELSVKGVHIAERDTQRAKNPKPRGRLRQHLVGRGVRLGRLAAGRTRLGHAREHAARQRGNA